MATKELRTRKTNFIKKFVENICDVFKTCEDTDTSIFEFYQWLRNDKNFKMQIDFAREIVFDQLEAKVFQRALSNPHVALKVLERWRPERWGDSVKNKDMKHEIENILPKEFYHITTEQFKQLAENILTQKLNLSEIEEVNEN